MLDMEGCVSNGTSCTIPNLSEHTAYSVSVETVVEYTDEADAVCTQSNTSAPRKFWTG